MAEVTIATTKIAINYATFLVAQMRMLVNELNKDSAYVNNNRNHILYGIIHTSIYILTLQIEMHIGSNRETDYIALFDLLLIELLGILFPDALRTSLQLPNYKIMLSIIMMFIKNMINIKLFNNQRTSNFIKHNIEEKIYPINITNVLKKTRGTILNDTDKPISLTLNINVYTNLTYITNYDMKLIDLINDTPANKNFFNLFIGLLISDGNDTNTDNIRKIIDDAVFKPVKSEQKTNINPIKEEDPEYVTKLLRRIECPICYTNESNIVLNCGHIICPECSKNPLIVSCPICRIPITTKQSIYYKKYLKYKNKYAILKKELN